MMWNRYVNLRETPFTTAGSENKTNRQTNRQTWHKQLSYCIVCALNAQLRKAIDCTGSIWIDCGMASVFHVTAQPSRLIPITRSSLWTLASGPTSGRRKHHGCGTHSTLPSPGAPSFRTRKTRGAPFCGGLHWVQSTGKSQHKMSQQ